MSLDGDSLGAASTSVAAGAEDVALGSAATISGSFSVLGSGWPSADCVDVVTA